MTVIRPNSVSGINSITAQADEIKVFKSNGTQGGLIIGGANLNATTGISTLAALKVTGNLDVEGVLTYQDVTNVDSLGIGTFRTGINVSGGQLDVGSNIKLGNAGVITATSFVGSGANLTGLNSDLVTDTSPQLGGHLDVNDFQIKNGNQIYEIVSNARHRFYSAGNQIIDINGNGVDFLHGNNTHADNVKSQFGASNDLQIVHDGSHSYLSNSTGYLYLQSDSISLAAKSAGENFLVANKDAEVILYYDSSETFRTVSNGIRILGTESAAGLLELYADEGDDNGDKWRFIAETNGTLNLQDYGSGNWYNNIRFTGHTGGVMLFQDNDAKFQTQSDGVRVEDGGHLYLHNDSENSSSYIRNTDSSNNSNIAFYTREGGSGNIRWNMTKSGQFIPNANNTYDIGDTSNRVRNIYTNDLNLSNKGSTNSVDNTWGDYTIQEGENDLFLINNRSGKKYKFNLTEVS
tara:strand:+ start:275 stop:1663 length:1389 start_codon:yes stop_codon:yes gene_type:complete